MNESEDLLKRHTEVRVVPWNPKWHDMFLKERAKLRGYLEKAGLKAEILHVGSTSVKDMWAKPIIDILILIPDRADPLNTPRRCRKTESSGMASAADQAGYSCRRTRRRSPFISM